MFIEKFVLAITIILFSSISLTAKVEMSDSVKEKKVYPIGKKIYEKKCNQDINLEKYISIDELKTSIRSDKLCQPLKDKHLEMLSIYLWDVKRVSTHKDTQSKMAVNRDEKCPICGMFVYKYPKWAAQIFYEKSHLSFDGVKDLMKYYFLKEDERTAIEKILVTDYYSQKTIDAKKAYFVLGSDIYGPMGEELIAFENKSDARTFYMDHQGKKILKFNEITSKEIYKLDE